MSAVVIFYVSVDLYKARTKVAPLVLLLLPRSLQKSYANAGAASFAIICKRKTHNARATHNVCVVVNFLLIMNFLTKWVCCLDILLKMCWALFTSICRLAVVLGVPMVMYTCVYAHCAA